MPPVVKPLCDSARVLNPNLACFQGTGGTNSLHPTPMKRSYPVVLLATLAAFSNGPAAFGANAAPADAAAAPAPVDQPAAFQSEALPPAGQANAAPRAARGGGGVTAAYVAVMTDDQLAQLHAKLDELNGDLKALKEAEARSGFDCGCGVVRLDCPRRRCGFPIPMETRTPSRIRSANAFPV